MIRVSLLDHPSAIPLAIHADQVTKASECLAGHSGNPEEYLLSVLIVSFSDLFHGRSKNLKIIISRMWFIV